MNIRKCLSIFAIVIMVYVPISILTGCSSKDKDNVDYSGHPIIGTWINTEIVVECCHRIDTTTILLSYQSNGSFTQTWIDDYVFPNGCEQDWQDVFTINGTFRLSGENIITLRAGITTQVLTFEISGDTLTNSTYCNCCNTLRVGIFQRVHD